MDDKWNIRSSASFSCPCQFSIFKDKHIHCFSYSTFSGNNPFPDQIHIFVCPTLAYQVGTLAEGTMPSKMFLEWLELILQQVPPFEKLGCSRKFAIWASATGSVYFLPDISASYHLICMGGIFYHYSSILTMHWRLWSLVWTSGQCLSILELICVQDT